MKNSIMNPKWSIHLVVWIMMMACVVSCSDSIPRVSPPETGDIYGQGWSATHSDGANSDFSKSEIPRDVRLAWFTKFEGTINLGATFGNDGTIYITTSAPGNHLCALAADTGEKKWCNNELNEFAVASGALVDKDNRIFVADNKEMISFNEYGTILWRTPIDGLPFSAQFTQTGRLIFITHIGTIYVLDRTTGAHVMTPKKLFSENVSFPAFNSRACMLGTRDCPCANTPAFDSRTGNLYFTCWFPDALAASLICMRYTEDPDPHLEQIWQNDNVPGGSASSPDISTDGFTVYVNDNVRSIHAIDTRSGAIRWSYNIGYAPGGSQSTSPDGYIFPAGGNGAGLLCLRDSGAYAALIWKSDTLLNRGVIAQSPAHVAIGTIKTDMFAYDLIVFDVRQGTIYDRERLPGRPLFSVGTTVGKNASVLLPTFNGYLYCFKPAL